MLLLVLAAVYALPAVDAATSAAAAHTFAADT